LFSKSIVRNVRTEWEDENNSVNKSFKVQCIMRLKTQGKGCMKKFAAGVGRVKEAAR
jgi:hypothetical protein